MLPGLWQREDHDDVTRTADGTREPSFRSTAVWFAAKLYLPYCKNIFTVDAADNCDPDKIKPKSSALVVPVAFGDSGGSQVNSRSHLPRHLPVGTKYVVESRGEFVHRFVELPNGARIPLRKRKFSRLRLYRAAGSNRQIWEDDRLAERGKSAYPI